jgi:hypothetical protein
MSEPTEEFPVSDLTVERCLARINALRRRHDAGQMHLHTGTPSLPDVRSHFREIIGLIAGKLGMEEGDEEARDLLAVLASEVYSEAMNTARAQRGSWADQERLADGLGGVLSALEVQWEGCKILFPNGQAIPTEQAFAHVLSEGQAAMVSVYPHMAQMYEKRSSEEAKP